MQSAKFTTGVSAAMEGDDVVIVEGKSTVVLPQSKATKLKQPAYDLPW